MPVRKTGALPEPIDRQVNEIIRAVNVIEEQIAKLSQGLRGQVDAVEGLSNQAYSLSVDLEMLNAKTSTMEGIVAAQGDEIRAILPITRDKLVDDVLSGLIVESGSNANGEYVRWGNGFQVCWGTVMIPANTGNIEKAMPAAFSGGFSITMTNVYWNTPDIAWSVSDSVGSTVRVDVRTFQGTNPTVDAYGRFIAVGRWK